MRHIREILRLKWTLKRSHRDTARSLGISPGAVASVTSRARAIGLTWDALAGLSEDAVEQRLYGPKVTGRPARPLADPAWIHTELRRAGVTLELLHLEYLGQPTAGSARKTPNTDTRRASPTSQVPITTDTPLSRKAFSSS
jgi:hypothetical protein